MNAPDKTSKGIKDSQGAPGDKSYATRSTRDQNPEHSKDSSSHSHAPLIVLGFCCSQKLQAQCMHFMQEVKASLGVLAPIPIPSSENEERGAVALV